MGSVQVQDVVLLFVAHFLPVLFMCSIHQRWWRWVGQTCTHSEQSAVQVLQLLSITDLHGFPGAENFLLLFCHNNFHLCLQAKGSLTMDLIQDLSTTSRNFSTLSADVPAILSFVPYGLLLTRWCPNQLLRTPCVKHRCSRDALSVLHQVHVLKMNRGN